MKINKETKNILMYTRVDYEMTNDEIVEELSKVSGLDKEVIKETDYEQRGKALIIFVEGYETELSDEDVEELNYLIGE